MTIKQLTTDVAGQVGVYPRRVKMITTDSVTTVTTAGYLSGSQQMGYTFYPTDIFDIWYDYVDDLSPGTYGQFLPTFSNGVITLSLDVTQGNVTFPVVSGNLPKFDGTAGVISDSGIAATSVIVNSNNSGQTIAATTSSATPGTIRSVIGSMTGTATTMTSGNLVGVRGVVNYVGASGGFIYGTQGKIIPTGTLSGSSWNAAVFGQLDISAATVNAGQTAALWGDYGSTSGTITDATGMRGIAMTNTTAAVLNAQVYLYGNATNLLELAGAGGTLNYYLTSGTSAGSAGDTSKCNAPKVLRFTENGNNCYIPVFTQNT